MSTSADAKKMTKGLIRKLNNFTPELNRLMIESCTPNELPDGKGDFTCNAVNKKTGDKFIIGVKQSKNHVGIDIQKQGYRDI